jgi:hypothetical protein
MWNAPKRELPYEPTEPAEGVGMVNATLFRKMGPELNPDQEPYESNSWSNSANGQNKDQINGMDDHKGAKSGEAWAPDHPYLPDSDAIADPRIPDGPSNLPYQSDKEDFDDILKQ